MSDRNGPTKPLLSPALESALEARDAANWRREVVQFRLAIELQSLPDAERTRAQLCELVQHIEAAEQAITEALRLALTGGTRPKIRGL